MNRVVSSNSEARAIKLKDVAFHAGCSPATASRALNGNPNVGTREREKVLAAAAQLGYIPNHSARALRSQSTNLVGVIIPTLDHAIYARMVSGLEEHLAHEGLSVIISTTEYDLGKELTQVKMLVGRGVESVVLVGLEHSAETTDYLRRAGVDQVFTYTAELGNADASVGFDNSGSAAIVARYLLDLGHRRFGMIAGVTRANDRARQRRDGFVEALLSAGIAQQDIIVLEAPYRTENGHEAMKSLMQTYPRPTAVFCGSDILAVGGIKYCRIAGISVPGEVSIVGFDNLEMASLVMPELTTVDVPARDMGRSAAEALLRLRTREDQSIVVELPTRLIVRETTGAPKA